MLVFRELFLTAQSGRLTAEMVIRTLAEHGEKGAAIERGSVLYAVNVVAPELTRPDVAKLMKGARAGVQNSLKTWPCAHTGRVYSIEYRAIARYLADLDHQLSSKRPG